MAEESELDRLDPQNQIIKLSTGFELEILRLRTRQLFRLLRIFTHGAGPAVMQAGLDFSAPNEDFVQKLLALVIMSIPDAEQETVGFIQSMCQPSGITDKPDSRLTKQEKEDNAALWEKFNKEMFNPLPDDTFDIIEAIVRREAPEMQALGKRLGGLLEMAQKTGQTGGQPEKVPEAQDLNLPDLPEPSLSSSTSSAMSTDGPTSTSSRSRSAGSASARRRQDAVAAASS